MAPLEDFFAQFARLGFTYQQNHTAHRNFNRLRKVARWENKSTTLAVARVDFNDALVQQFNFVYGTEVNNLASWQNLCTAIDIVPVPNTIKKCRKLVWDANVNIMDLLECARTGQRVRKFDTLEELREYTMKPGTGMMFPKENLYAGGLLRELLREIVNPYFGKRQNGSAKQKARKEKARRKKESTRQQGKEAAVAASVSELEQSWE